MAPDSLSPDVCGAVFVPRNDRDLTTQDRVTKPRRKVFVNTRRRSEASSLRLAASPGDRFVFATRHFVALNGIRRNLTEETGHGA